MTFIHMKAFLMGKHTSHLQRGIIFQENQCWLESTQNVLQETPLEAYVVIADPPRNGMHPAVVKQLLFLQPDKIVYVSCNPSTQARDLFLMKDHYKLVRSKAIDLFPQTQHVENVVLLEKI